MFSWRLDNLVVDCEEEDFTTSQYSEGFALYEEFDDACLEDLRLKLMNAVQLKPLV